MSVFSTVASLIFLLPFETLYSLLSSAFLAARSILLSVEEKNKRDDEEEGDTELEDEEVADSDCSRLAPTAKLSCLLFSCFFSVFFSLPKLF